jgi:hypothetical protein
MSQILITDFFKKLDLIKKVSASHRFAEHKEVTGGPADSGFQGERGGGADQRSNGSGQPLTRAEPRSKARWSTGDRTAQVFS